jgi:hypothetical protein
MEAFVRENCSANNKNRTQKGFHVSAKSVPNNNNCRSIPSKA